MAVLPLIIAPDARLNEPSQPVERFDEALRALVRDMFDTMYANKGIGLAAVQVGVHQRIIVIDTEWGSPRHGGSEEGEPKPGNPLVFINAEIVDESEEESVYNEGCLSFPDNFSEVERPATVTLRYQDAEGKAHTLTAEGLLATCIQHEIDHTNGIVFVDHISRLKRDMILRRLKKAKKLGTLQTEQIEPAKVL